MGSTTLRSANSNLALSLMIHEVTLGSRSAKVKGAGPLKSEQGAPPSEISPILGHASVEITYRLYAHVVPQAQQHALIAIERIHSG
jgi:hypothetical protein